MQRIVCTVSKGKIVGLYCGGERVDKRWFNNGQFDHSDRKILERLGYRRLR